MSNRRSLRKIFDAIPWLIYALTLIYFVGCYYFSFRRKKLQVDKGKTKKPTLSGFVPTKHFRKSGLPKFHFPGLIYPPVSGSGGSGGGGGFVPSWPSPSPPLTLNISS